MKILWLTIDRSNRIAHHFDDFRQAVSKLSEVEVHSVVKSAFSGGASIWKQSKDLISGKFKIDNVIPDVLSKYTPDFIFCDAFFAYTNEPWPDIPSAIFIEDVHNEVPRAQVEIAKQIGISTIFHRFNFPFHKYHSDARKNFNCFWLPHSIDMSRFNDYFSKSIEVLHVGVYRESYPFRRFIVDTLSSKSYFKLVERPKDVHNESRSGKWPIDRDYDNLLQKSRLVVTGGSRYNAPVQKYFEIPAANSLLVSNWFPDLGLLGFVPKTSMISCHKENLVETIEYLLANPEEVERISINGYNLILLKHTSDIRAKQFVNNICNLIKVPKLYEVEPCSFQVNFNYNRKQPQAATAKAVPDQVEQPDSDTKTAIITGTDWRSRIKAEEARTKGYEVIRN